MWIGHQLSGDCGLTGFLEARALPIRVAVRRDLSYPRCIAQEKGRGETEFCLPCGGRGPPLPPSLPPLSQAADGRGHLTRAV